MPTENDTDVVIIFLTLLTCYLGHMWLEESAKKQRVRRFYCRSDNLDHNKHGFFEVSFKAIKLNPEEFFNHTRMNLPLYNILLSLLEPHLTKRKCSNTIGVEERLALTLSCLSQGVSPQYLGWSFKVGRSTAREIILETCDVIWNILSPLYVCQPNTEDYKLIANDFENIWDLPNCVGAIDGKHINIQSPEHSGSQFYNYKNFYSVVLLAACDARYTFTMVDVGAFGSQSDGGILTESEFGKQLLSHRLPLPEERYLPKTELKFPFFFIGDPAFPLKNNLLRAYPGKCLTLEKKIYNYRISRARVVIENAFGILVARWRILRGKLNYSPKNAENIVLATIALHNFIKLNQTTTHMYCPPNFVDSEDTSGNTRPGKWREDITLSSSAIQHHNKRIGSNNSSQLAFKFRDTLKMYFMNEGRIEKQNKIK